eukprot:CAMPEP_0115555446 /NCGR_PEP_ID=MMETSP0271-20121206/97831_1 /TAXON_ID=71861 /ORGANISM="Scrippsiella trochoidea, Strain CCMP3099" /LENGTH=56 /DNA_ID=CAMNT_0002989239 /DNA_START=40 /DNA_END=210 /DNA_ORIENTATION=-
MSLAILCARTQSCRGWLTTDLHHEESKMLSAKKRQKFIKPHLRIKAAMNALFHSAQ